MQSTTSPAAPEATSSPIPQRTPRERLAGATLEFLDAKSRNSAATLVGEGFRRLCERWGLGAADWETESGSVARALVDDATAARLAPLVSDLLVEGYLVRTREMAGSAGLSDLNLATIHLVDWLDRFTPFRFIAAWTSRGGPTDEFWAFYVETILAEANSLDDAESGTAGNKGGTVTAGHDVAATENWLARLRQAQLERVSHGLPWEAVSARISRLCEIAPLNVIASLASRLEQPSLLLRVAEAPRITEPAILAGALGTREPRFLAVALFALETLPELLKRVADEKARSTASPPKPLRTADSPSELTTPAASHEATCFAAGAVRSRLVDILLLATGIEFLRFLAFAILWILGLRQGGVLSIDAKEIRVSTRTAFLGRDVRANEIRVPTASVRGVTASKAWRILYLLVGLIAIAAFTLLGVSAIFDGVARQHAGIITFGALLIASGLIVDGACYWLFLRGGERVFVKVDLAPPARSIRLWVARKSADGIVAALARIASRAP